MLATRTVVTLLNEEGRGKRSGEKTVNFGPRTTSRGENSPPASLETVADLSCCWQYSNHIYCVYQNRTKPGVGHAPPTNRDINSRNSERTRRTRNPGHLGYQPLIQRTTINSDTKQLTKKTRGKPESHGVVVIPLLFPNRRDRAAKQDEEKKIRLFGRCRTQGCMILHPSDAPGENTSCN